MTQYEKADNQQPTPDAPPVPARDEVEHIASLVVEYGRVEFERGTGRDKSMGFIRYLAVVKAVAALVARAERAERTAKEWQDAERALSEAYLRLRQILNAWNTPCAPTPEQVWEHTESCATDLRARLSQVEQQRRTMERTIATLRSALENWGRHHCWCKGPGPLECNCGYRAALEIGYKVGAGILSSDLSGAPQQERCPTCGWRYRDGFRYGNPADQSTVLCTDTFHQPYLERLASTEDQTG